MGKHSTYILKTGISAIETLEKQHNFLANNSFRQLEKAGLKEGQIIWDIGCGTGAMTEYLARSVGEDGHVYALDISKNQLEITEERIEKANLQNVTLIQGDIVNITTLPIQQADIVYSRLILMHLQNPEAAIRKMSSLLKLNGVLLLQESTLSTTHASSHNSVVNNYIQTLVALGRTRDVDFDIGKKLPLLCSKINFAKIEHYTSQDKLTASEAKDFLSRRLLEWQDDAIKAKLISAEQIEAWRDKIQDFPEDDSSFYLTLADQTHILAWK